jgi:outer membrane protein OmpA-like peptidoglycan-associated protein
MEKALLAKITVGNDQLGALAARRGIAVENRLAAKGIPADRMFLVNARSEGRQEVADEAVEGRKKAPEARVDLYLK